MKMNIIYRFIMTTAIMGMSMAMLSACSGKRTVKSEEPQLVGPTFNPDSALAFCREQCAFGPRTMNSEAHEKCCDYISGKFREYSLDVEHQKAELTGWDGNKLRSTNIIAHYNGDSQRRILICAHWDSRPWADNDADSTNWNKPVLAANDGASGVGVMLELARILSSDTVNLAVGIDFVCFDAEDYGVPQWRDDIEDADDSWALGAQYFAKNLSTKYEYAILLDMVGGQGARFYQEGLSLNNAAGIVDKVWSRAYDAGFSGYFVSSPGGKITDDHKPLIEAGIPAIDIIAYYPDCEQSSFGPTWHTVNDTMENLDPNVLKAVGQTLVQVLFTE